MGRRFLRVTGVTFPNADGTHRQRHVRAQHPGLPLRLRREPDNPYDTWAVAVEDAQQRQLGYLPRHEGRWISEQLLVGLIVPARVAVVSRGPRCAGMVIEVASPEPPPRASTVAAGRMEEACLEASWMRRVGSLFLAHAPESEWPGGRSDGSESQIHGLDDPPALLGDDPPGDEEDYEEDEYDEEGS